jgi:hypothetical protein
MTRTLHVVAAIVGFVAASSTVYAQKSGGILSST